MMNEEVSEYTIFYIELLEEFGDKNIISLDEFDKIVQKSDLSEPDDVLWRLGRFHMIKPANGGGIQLNRLTANDTAFHFLPLRDQAFLIAHYFHK